MPFDGVASPYCKHLEKLDEAINLVRSPGQWCKGSERNSAGQYCIRGALVAVGAWDTLRPVVTASVREVGGGHFRRIEEFNDHPLTTHDDVLNALYRARERIIAGNFVPPIDSAGVQVRRPLWQTVAAGWRKLLG